MHGMGLAACCCQFFLLLPSGYDMWIYNHSDNVVGKKRRKKGGKKVPMVSMYWQVRQGSSCRVTCALNCLAALL